MSDLPAEAITRARRAFPAAAPHALKAALEAAAPAIRRQAAEAEHERIRRFAATLDNGSDDEVMTLIRQFTDAGAAAERARIVAELYRRTAGLDGIRPGETDATVATLELMATTLRNTASAIEQGEHAENYAEPAGTKE